VGEFDAGDLVGGAVGLLASDRLGLVAPFEGRHACQVDTIEGLSDPELYVAAVHTEFYLSLVHLLHQKILNGELDRR